MKKAKISILMTVFNHQKYVRSSINSILKQSFKNYEFVIIDNGSTDLSKNIIKKIKDKRIRFYFLKKNIGRTNCLNFGLSKCKCKYVAILDSDDISRKDRLKIQFNYLEKNKNIKLVASNYNVIDEKNKILRQSNIKNGLLHNPKKILFENIIAHSTVMYRKELINKIGPYPKKFTYAQDYAFYLKIIKKNKIDLLTKNLVNLRSNHSDSETFRLNKSKLIQIEELKLIFWILKNIETNFYEKIKLFYKILKINLKILRFWLFNFNPIN